MVQNIAKNSPNKLQKVANFQNSNSMQKNYLPTYEENVFPAARAAV